jgi:hypothetical protein
VGRRGFISFLAISLTLPLLAALPAFVASDPPPRLDFAAHVEPFHDPKPVEIPKAKVPEPMDQAQPKPPAPVAQATENDWLALCAADVVQLPPEDRFYTRYIPIPNGKILHGKVASLLCNYLSLTPIITRPEPLGKDALLVMRMDLRKYATGEKLVRLIQTWEELRYEPRLNLLLTKETLRFALNIKIPKVKKTVTKLVDKVIDVPEYIHTDGKKYNQKKVQEKVEEVIEVDGLSDDTDVVRQVSPHLDLKLVELLVEATHSQAPVVSLPYFLIRGLDQLQDKGVKKTVWGGLYLRFRGIRQGVEKENKKLTDEDVYFSSIGVADLDPEKGFKAKDVFNQIGSDARVAVATSRVTSRPRRIDFLRTRSGHFNVNTSIVSITQDLARDNVDIGVHPLMNLDPCFVNKFDAKEIITEMINGLNEFLIENGDGGILDEADANKVVTDTSIPSPFQQVLRPAISCIRCHANDFGWQKVTNDVNRLTINKFLDIYDDISVRKYGKLFSRDQVIDRLVGQYAGDPELLALPRARDDYARAILRATGPWDGSKDNTDIVRLSGNEIASIYGDYWYKKLTAVDALTDLGVAWGGTDAKAAGKKLREILSLDTNAVNANTQWVYQPKPGEVVLIPEDARIGLLMEGVGITRTDYDLIYSFIATRYATKKLAVQK